MQQEIEDRLLFLIQLWFDTFMLHENEYKEIIKVYKDLRLEGVLFPMRDPQCQFFINFNGKKSPIFETIEGKNIYEEPNKFISKNKFKVKELKIENSITQESEELQYEELQNNHTSDVYQINKEQIKNMKEMILEIQGDPKSTIENDLELGEILFEEIKKIVDQIGKLIESDSDQITNDIREDYFFFKKFNRKFEEAMDEIKQGKTEKVILEEDFLGLEVEEKKEELDFLGMEEQPQEVVYENQNKNINMKEEQKIFKETSKEQAFDFIDDHIGSFIQFFVKVNFDSVKNLII